MSGNQNLGNMNIPASDPAVPRSGKGQRNIAKSASWIIFFAAPAALAVGIILIYRDTLISPGHLFLISVLSAVILWFPMRGMYKVILSNLNRYLQFLIHTVFASLICCFLFLWINSRFAYESTLRIERAEVVAHYREKHYRSQRVSRHSYRRGEPYYVYVVALRFPSGSEKNFRLSLSQYNRLRTGLSISISVREGFFGFPVVKNPFIS